jgi:hypothetical protein
MAMRGRLRSLRIENPSAHSSTTQPSFDVSSQRERKRGITYSRVPTSTAQSQSIKHKVMKGNGAVVAVAGVVISQNQTQDTGPRPAVQPSRPPARPPASCCLLKCCAFHGSRGWVVRADIRARVCTQWVRVPSSHTHTSLHQLVARRREARFPFF